MNNAIDFDKFAFDPSARARLRDELNIKGFCIGSIGRAVYQKNQTFLLKAFAEFLKICPDATLVLIADGAKRDELIETAKKLELGERFILLSERANAYEYYNAFDCFALPSHYEGLPIVGIEAQANGLPCFFADAVTDATAVGGKCEFLPISDPALWAKHIADIMPAERYNVLDEIKENGYEIKSAAAVLTEKYLELYNSIKR